jgi:hypothetical protein
VTRPPRGVPEAATLELPEPAVELDAVKVVGAEAAATRLTVLSLVESTLLRCNLANVSAQRASLVQVDGPTVTSRRVI